VVKDAQIVAANLRDWKRRWKAMKGQTLAIAGHFYDVSAAMIELGKNVGTPCRQRHGQGVSLPHEEGELAAEGDATVNPYYGSKMYDCGTRWNRCPSAPQLWPSRAKSSAAAGESLVVPRSAVIDTGRAKIVYVESTPGVTTCER